MRSNFGIGNIPIIQEAGGGDVTNLNFNCLQYSKISVHRPLQHRPHRTHEREIEQGRAEIWSRNVSMHPPTKTDKK